MDGKVRFTVVALLPKNVKADSFQLFVEKIITEIEPAVISKLYQTSPPGLGVELSFAKISKLIEPGELRSDWHLQITERFRRAGCENVAWRITKINPGETEPENTTESFPVELFRGCLAIDPETVRLPDISGDFGSEKFWTFFEDGE